MKRRRILSTIATFAFLASCISSANASGSVATISTTTIHRPTSGSYQFTTDVIVTFEVFIVGPLVSNQCWKKTPNTTGFVKVYEENNLYSGSPFTVVDWWSILSTSALGDYSFYYKSQCQVPSAFGPIVTTYQSNTVTTTVVSP